VQKQNRLFVACVLALVATSFGFVLRAMLLPTIGVELNLTETQKGALGGAGLFPFALSIIFFSLIIDRIGYGTAMAFAWVGHVASAIITITARSYEQLYAGTLLFALANGTIEAVVNPVTTTMFSTNKTHRLNILHSGWAGGLVLGGLLFLALPESVGWRIRIGLFIIPAVIYGAMMVGQKFPVQERVTAGVSYTDMLKEFGWASCFIVCWFACQAIDAVATAFGGNFLGAEHPFAWAALWALIPTIFFAIKYKSFGRPMFVFLLLIMTLSATTELGTDSWITDLLTPAMKQLGMQAGWVLVYTSSIMLVLRLSAGPLVHKLSPLGLLATCSAICALGIYWLAVGGTTAGIIFVAATLYGVGKTFFWPTTLGVVSEQFPKGGALTLNAIGGMGMIAVGTVGATLLGTLQDHAIDTKLMADNPAIHAQVIQYAETEKGAAPKPLEKSTFGISYTPLDQTKIEKLPEADKAQVDKVKGEAKLGALATVSTLPAIMFVCYLGLIFYFKSKGGYKPVQISST
jgi:MFS family permease